jgi:hypothetical protein
MPNFLVLGLDHESLRAAQDDDWQLFDPVCPGSG